MCTTRSPRSFLHCAPSKQPHANSDPTSLPNVTCTGLHRGKWQQLLQAHPHGTYVTTLAQATFCPVLRAQTPSNAAKPSVNLRDDLVAAHFPAHLSIPPSLPPTPRAHEPQKRHDNYSCCVSATTITDECRTLLQIARSGRERCLRGKDCCCWNLGKPVRAKDISILLLVPVGAWAGSRPFHRELGGIERWNRRLVVRLVIFTS